jgi:Spy/CpxP family protein refolding chaperone
MKRALKILAISTLIFGIGTATAVFAHGRYDGGYGHHMGGYGRHMDGYGPGNDGGWGADRGGTDLSAEQRDAIETERENFFRETRALREGMDEKAAAIEDEFSKENPDRGRIQQLQKELSGLRSDFDEKRLDHQLKMKKIAPELNRGPARYGKGESGKGRYGKGGTGRGGYGPGACWR